MELSSHLFYLIIEFSAIMRIFTVSCCNKGGSWDEMTFVLERIFQDLVPQGGFIVA